MIVTKISFIFAALLTKINFMKKIYFFKLMAVAISLIIVTMSCDDPIKPQEDVRVTGVTLDKNNISLVVGNTETLKETVLPGDAKNKAVTWTSSNSTIATVVNGTVTAVKEGTATITVTTTDGGYKATCTVTVTKKPDEPDPNEGVVIAGVTWATRNVDMPGTFAAKPEDAGMFYQWSRKIGWSSIDPMINSDGGNTWSDFYPNDPTWATANDPCPQGWRVPTHEEQKSLVNSGIGEWTTLNGVNGRFFGSGNNKVFLPAAGFRGGSSGNLVAQNNYGSYWSNTRANTAAAYDLYLNIGAAGTTTSDVAPSTIDGLSVRCVKQ